MFSLRLHFPILEMIWSNRALAVIHLPNDQLRVLKIKPIKGQFFVTEWGWFRMKPEWGTGLFKQKIYHYVSWNQNPVDFRAVKELELFLIKTDRVALEKWIEEEDQKLLEKAEEISGMDLQNESDSQGNVKLDEEKKPIKLAEKKRKMILRALREPVSTRFETWLMQFEKVDASGTLTGVEKVISLKKLLKQMSNPITTKYPLIIMMLIAFVLIALITQGGNLMDHLFAGLQAMKGGHP